MEWYVIFLEGKSERSSIYLFIYIVLQRGYRVLYIYIYGFMYI